MFLLLSPSSLCFFCLCWGSDTSFSFIRHFPLGPLFFTLGMKANKKGFEDQNIFIQAPPPPPTTTHHHRHHPGSTPHSLPYIKYEQIEMVLLVCCCSSGGRQHVNSRLCLDSLLHSPKSHTLVVFHDLFPLVFYSILRYFLPRLSSLGRRCPVLISVYERVVKL